MVPPLLRIAVLVGGGAAALTAPTPAPAATPTVVRASHVRAFAHLSAGRSLGSPTDGRLVGGTHLEDTPYLRIVPVYQAGDVRWGLGSLVELLDDSARAVHKQFPDAVMSVGHLSRHGGGDIDRHASHESGRDADIGFYIKSQTGRPLYSDHFVAFKGDGSAPTWPGAYFDDARNWALVSALSTDAHARVTYLFVATPIRARLLAYAERAGAPLAVRSRAAELMVQPKGALPHDDHFHVRIGCPAGSSGCMEYPTTPRERRIARAALPHTRTATSVTAASAATVAAPSAVSTAALASRSSAAQRARQGLDSEAAGLTPGPTADVEHGEEPGRSSQPGAPPSTVWAAPVDDVDGPLVPPTPDER